MNEDVQYEQGRSAVLAQGVLVKIGSNEWSVAYVSYFRNLAEAAMRLYNKTFFSKTFKVLADFNKLLNFEKFLIYVLPKI